MLDINKIYNQDCLEGIKQIDDKTIDLILTDPPYKMEIHGRGFAAQRDYYKELDYGTSPEFELSEEWFNQCLRVLKEVNLVIFCNKNLKLDIENWAVKNKFTYDEIVLCKSAPAPLTNNQWLPDKEFAVHVFRKCKVKGNYHTKRTFFVDNNYKDTEIEHPSVKPLYIIEHILKNCSVENDVVLDCFMGSGTTALACQNNNRNFIGFELNPKFIEISDRRLKDAQSLDSFF